jgi:hypothetical protein
MGYGERLADFYFVISFTLQNCKNTEEVFFKQEQFSSSSFIRSSGKHSSCYTDLFSTSNSVLILLWRNLEEVICVKGKCSASLQEMRK